jgi:hypothetical protein
MRVTPLQQRALDEWTGNLVWAYREHAGIALELSSHRRLPRDPSTIEPVDMERLRAAISVCVAEAARMVSSPNKVVNLARHWDLRVMDEEDFWVVLEFDLPPVVRN